MENKGKRIKQTKQLEKHSKGNKKHKQELLKKMAETRKRNTK